MLDERPRDVDATTRPAASTPESARARLLARAIEPPLATAAIPGVGGALRTHVEDFVVRELPAYAADGREHAHLLLTLRKRGMTTEYALAELARQLDIPRREIGVAGLKDRHALTEQWITVPWAARAALARVHHDDLWLGPAQAHKNKLRRGHLRGNRFAVVLRDLAREPRAAQAVVQRKLELLRAQGGLENLYGPQRFGHGGRNADRGLSLLAAPPAARRRVKADLIVSAGQSALFNLYVLTRRERGLLQRVLAGDILQKTATGGMFESTEPAQDQARVESGEVQITGPIFGSKTRTPSVGTAARALEDAVLASLGIERATLEKLGRKVPGTRRALQLPLDGDVVTATCMPAELDDARDDWPPPPPPGPGLRLEFLLPPGSYATQLLREITGPIPPAHEDDAMSA